VLNGSPGLDYNRLYMLYNGASKSRLNENPFDARSEQMQWKSDRDPRAALGQKIQEVSAEKNVRGEMARHGDLWPLNSLSFGAHSRRRRVLRPANCPRTQRGRFEVARRSGFWQKSGVRTGRM